MEVSIVDDADERPSATASVFAAVLERRVRNRPHLAAAPWLQRLDAACQLRLLVTSAMRAFPPIESALGLPVAAPCPPMPPSATDSLLVDKAN